MALQKIHSEGKDNENGICFGLNGAIRDEFKALCKQWPKYSGDPEFPVPFPSGTPREGYIGTPNLWAGEYGELRRELLAWALGLTIKPPSLPKPAGFTPAKPFVPIPIFKPK